MKLLIANRGEIAIRIARAASSLGVDSVAIFTRADSLSLHTKLAGSAREIGGDAVRGYLDIDAVVAAALESGAQALHPGYGFLSENAELARACDRAGIVFIGPTADTIERMGSKSEAKRLMESAGVPVVPGYHGSVQTGAVLAAEAARVGSRCS